MYIQVIVLNMQVIDSDWSELHQIDFKKYGHSSQMRIEKFCGNILNKKKNDDTIFSLT